ncbi:NAD-glutamate dehydrogenase [Thauera sinica]|uniref:NAD-glutamate dehydrogenase n=1 Tax=Thauera sinica TaxID=2665146 RepID=A0ABW1APW8_9RHOO|nr:NAD-glutamate dehydrogenase [Thauera sp. K11]ATE62220.1 NAD-glutamate dehydrogenase [Thauera sp. K11]
MQTPDTTPHVEAFDPVARVADAIAARLPADEAAEAAEFARQYFALTAPEDLAERPPDDLYGAVLSHWHFARTFSGGAPRLRVYNPRLEEHGWQSTHTVVEIVNDDMPFLVDSITNEVNRQGLMVHLVVHPVMKIRRDVEHRIVHVARSRNEAEGRFESLIHVEVDHRTERAQLDALHDGLLRILGDVRAAVEDWRRMQQRIVDILAELELSPPPPVPAQELADARAFLQWIADDNFTLLGCRDYDLVRDPAGTGAADGSADELRVVPGSGLGILREHGQALPSLAFSQMPPELRACARARNLLTLTKANARATVHRAAYLDYIGVKRFDAAGEVIGERRLLGLYTSVAYSTSPTQIPLLRSKVSTVTQRAGFLPKSHAAKALATILEQYPRDELIQTSADDLYATAMGILRLGERQRTRLFVRRDTFGRYYACLLFVPRENYNTDVRQRMQTALSEALHGVSSEFNVHLSDSPLARILIVIRTPPGAAPDFDVHELEQQLVRLARRWEDDLAQALIEAVGEERGNALFAKYAAGFAAGYREEHAARMAVHDIEQLETLDAPDAIAMNLYLPLEAPPGRLRFKLIRAGELAPLSQSLPMLEHMGVRVLEERPFEVRRADGQELWIDDFGLAVPEGATMVAELDIERLRGPFQETFRRTWRGDNDDDDFNRLVLLAGLDWRSVTVLRAYARYMKQAAFTFSQHYIEQALASHPAIAAELIALFRARFDPAQDEARDARQAQIAERIAAALDGVTNLDEDRILRHYLALIQATLRTNFFQCDTDGQPRGWLSFKFDPSGVPLLPEPRPMFEIFVHSPRVEGVHLRGGRVARGGLRWSDRMEDYRTEVLGLVKAQQVKNAVIVPVGSKGGFVLKRPPAGGDRDALMREGIACYQIYLRGLLDLTDNLAGGQVVPPRDVVRHDGDDPYLVVAADKGTATFSDIANRTAAEYGFWLGDAFASGGSAGYDHKGMGITARGAWESVKRHFRSLGRDSQTQDFTVVGIGDMSGDVFGNGMLLSRHIRLVAAFDHRHIFIDPDPDAAAGFAERERLFKLPRSSWADYDATLISRGGGIFPRGAKSVALSPQARSTLGIEAEQLSPAELIHAILQAPVDLLYNGGIGTYVKASTESHAEVGDRANDAIRVDGAQLRCKVVAEGGNLGVTQRGRIEFALRGGLINTDAIDNSGGVDCSDHEVNIKILLNQVVAEGELTGKQRDRLLAEMTDEVAQLVLRDNRGQNQILALERARGAAQLDEQARYMRHLAGAGRLNRRLEFLPSDEAIAERGQARTGLTTPELAVLLAYGKMELYDAVLASGIPEDPYIATAVERYFPKPLRERFLPQIGQHPLRREIVATHVVNSMINRVGPTFCFRLQEETGAAPADIVRAYLGTREIFGLVALWNAAEALDHSVPVGVQQDILQASMRLALRGTVWLLQRRAILGELDAAIGRFAPGVAEVGNGLGRWLAPHERTPIDAEADRLAAQGVPKSLALRIAQLGDQFSALDIVEIAGETARTVETVADVYFGLGGRLDLGWLSQQISTLPADGHWSALARVALRDDLTAIAHGLARSVLDLSPQEQDTGALIAAWEARREAHLARCRQLLAELHPASTLDLAMLSVTLRQLRALI